MPNKAAMLAADIRQLEHWQRTNLPNFHDAATQAVVSWLLANNGETKPLAKLYETPGYGVGALRGAITLLAFNSLVEVSRDKQDARRFTAKPTQKLIGRMQQYAEKLQQIIQQYPQQPSSTGCG
jgi:hypothetical protein